MIRAVCVIVCLIAAPAWAAVDDTPRVPTLDELLGLAEPGSDAPGEDRTELERALSPERAGEAFEQAVDLMERASGRLRDRRDAGIATQRIQEDILRTLDQVISSAQEQQSRSSGSPSSSSGSSSSPGAQPDQSGARGQAGQRPGGESGDAGARPGSGEVVRSGRERTDADWGDLPPRLRDALSQGFDDPYSRLYRRLTERYYKELARDEGDER